MHYEGVRRCQIEERERILEVINTAAVAYRGVIPDDCWREPYMPASELDHELAADVAFWGYDLNGSLIGVMGIQPVGDVDLIRHAYVMPGNQRRGVGAALVRDLRRLSTKPMLVGTWAAADWAASLEDWCRATRISSGLMFTLVWRNCVARGPSTTYRLSA